MHVKMVDRARLLRAGIVAALVLALTGCGISIPSDPQGTLDRATGEELRIGLAIEPGLSEGGAPPTGPLVDLANEYATSIDARPEWEIGGEETLIEMLEQEQIDIAFGNFSEDSPWSDRAALSRPFTADGGGAGMIVALMPLGENALVSSFERFVDDTGRAQ
ncbi:hypothetical protein [Leucobacter sp. NPDC077196]|uniref:hypothetical protein n=1 Tax=Leucobacter sp. NPDC077196 TaxID=3154959 RepID=UPI00343CFBBA